MFDEPPKGNVEDIFENTPDASTPPSAKGGIARGINPLSKGEMPVATIIPHVMPSVGAQQDKSGETVPPILEAGSGKAKKIVIVVAGVLLVSMAGGGLWWYFSNRVEGEDIPTDPLTEVPVDNTITPPAEAPIETEPLPEPTPPPIQEPIVPPPVSEPPPQPLPEPTPILPPPPPPSDQDHDGLTDAEELSIGTNSNGVDTDNDGLFDYEEVKVYRTDPKRRDSDGDGYSDGQEVKSGYNPNGAGRVSEINQ